MSTTKTIAIVGWYGASQNVGDTLFQHAFRQMLDGYGNLVFSEHIPTRTSPIDLLIFGGGSFLDAPIIAEHHSDGARAPTFSEPLFGSGLGSPDCTAICYVGVGAEGISQDHEILLRHAKFVALRSTDNIDAVRALNSNVSLIPDLVYSLASPTRTVARTPAQMKSILVLPNISCVPKYSDPSWKTLSWQHFKFEYAQMLDALIADGYSIDYLAMCQNPEQNDHYAMAEIRNLMHKGHLIRNVDYSCLDSFYSLTSLFARYGVVLTQRYHGCIIAECAGTKYCSIAHHDKLRSTTLNEGIFTDYYACSRATLLSAFEQATALQLTPELGINSHLFEELKGSITELLE